MREGNIGRHQLENPECWVSFTALDGADGLYIIEKLSLEKYATSFGPMPALMVEEFLAQRVDYWMDVASRAAVVIKNGFRYGVAWPHINREAAT